jgi:uncharacterized FlaG/YvyC family protein
MADTFLSTALAQSSDPLNKRIKKLCQKLKECTSEQKKSYIVKIIDECAYNRTSNQPKRSKNGQPGKTMRKKTSEELKLLEYFMEQDPKWTTKTVNSAAKVLGLTPYQVYKWGYDRKNKKQCRSGPQFLKELEITNTMIEKINKFDHEIKGQSVIDLNKQVEDLFSTVTKPKGSSAALSEIPIGQLSLHQSTTQNCLIFDDSDFSPFEHEESAPEPVFSIVKVSRKRKCAEKYEETCSKNLSNGLRNKLIVP